MTTVSDILTFLNTVAPPSFQESWDRVGLNCGHLDHPVTKVLVALDPFDQACTEAKQWGAELLVTHHALLWNPGFITDETPQGKRALFLIENGIAHINAHTNLDCAPNGVNDQLAGVLGLKNIRVLNPSGVDSAGQEWGLLRMGQVPQQDLADFLSSVKQALGCIALRYVNSRKSVCRIAVGGGACAGELQQVAEAGCDTFVTSDIKYNQFWDARDLGLNLIDAGHFHTENPVCSYLSSRIQAAFPQIQVKISETHADCMKFF